MCFIVLLTSLFTIHQLSFPRSFKTAGAAGVIATSHLELWFLSVFLFLPMSTWVCSHLQKQADRCFGDTKLLMYMNVWSWVSECVVRVPVMDRCPIQDVLPPHPSVPMALKFDCKIDQQFLRVNESMYE